MKRGKLIYNAQTNQDKRLRQRYLLFICIIVLLFLLCLYISLFGKGIFFRILFGFSTFALLFIFYMLIAQFRSLSPFKIYEKGFLWPTEGYALHIDLKPKYIPYNAIERIFIKQDQVQVHFYKAENKKPIIFPLSALNIPLDRFIELLGPHTILDVQAVKAI